MVKKIDIVSQQYRPPLSLSMSAETGGFLGLSNVFGYKSGLDTFLVKLTVQTKWLFEFDIPLGYL